MDLQNNTPLHSGVNGKIQLPTHASDNIVRGLNYQVHPVAIQNYIILRQSCL